MSRDIMLWFVKFSFSLSLLLSAVSGALLYTFDSPQHLERAIKDSGVYTTAATLLSEELAKAGDDPIVQPTAREAIDASLPPAQMQRATEQLIDGSYRWLDGSVAEPDFRIDLTTAVERYTAVIADAAEKRAALLPVCNADQLRQLQSMLPSQLNRLNQSSDIQSIGPEAVLSLHCLPPGINPATVRQQTVAHVKDTNQLAVDPILTANTFPKDKQGLRFYERLGITPAAYRAQELAPWAFGAVCTIMAVLIVVLERKAIRAGYSVAKGIRNAGVLLLFVSGLAHILFIATTQPGGIITQSVDGTLQQYIISVARSLEAVLSRALLLIGTFLAVGGGIAALGLRLTVSRQERNLSITKTGAETSTNPDSTTSQFTTIQASDVSPQAETYKATDISFRPAPPLAKPGTTFTPQSNNHRDSYEKTAIDDKP